MSRVDTEATRYPLALSPPFERHGLPPSSRQGAEPRILLLDDDAFTLHLHSLMLSSMGWRQFSTVTSAEQALSRLLHDAPAVDLIVCDLQMPGMDGIEFLRTLDASGLRCSVILLSGQGPRILHTVQKLLAGGRLEILGALEKPACAPALQALLERWRPLVPALPAAAGPVYCGADLEAALRGQEWLLHYQPKVDLHSDALLGVEALVRWNHPVDGLVAPDRFIPLAEDCGAIDGLTDWVLQAALTQLAQWHSQGLALQMAVNVSMANLSSPGFARRLGALSGTAGVAPHDLTIEVTESRLPAQASTALENLVRLRLLGFGLSIDDFGTGYASLAQLRDVPFGELKIDRSFVRGARSNPLTRPILEASIALARRLDMVCVAEGVENEDDWHLLREIGCAAAQGYFIGAPMPADDLPAWRAQWQRQSRRVGSA
jgi:EAL domain-containing protein (putative c-di-GMP-specific phosphodiesterase class I)/ActR/RegA family two-component response regulator